MILALHGSHMWEKDNKQINPQINMCSQVVGGHCCEEVWGCRGAVEQRQLDRLSGAWAETWRTSEILQDQSKAGMTWAEGTACAKARPWGGRNAKCYVQELRRRSGSLQSCAKKAAAWYKAVERGRCQGILYVSRGRIQVFIVRVTGSHWKV